MLQDASCSYNLESTYDLGREMLQSRVGTEKDERRLNYQDAQRMFEKGEGKGKRLEQREHLAQFDLACESVKVIRHFFPELLPLLKRVEDPRHQRNWREEGKFSAVIFSWHYSAWSRARFVQSAGHGPQQLVCLADWGLCHADRCGLLLRTLFKKRG